MCIRDRFERTLDDSANKRLSIPEGFLAIESILHLCLNVVDGLVVYDKVIYAFPSFLIRTSRTIGAIFRSNL